MFNMRLVYLCVAACIFQCVWQVHAFGGGTQFDQNNPWQRTQSYKIAGKPEHIAEFERTYKLLETFSENPFFFNQFDDIVVQQYIDQLVAATHHVQMPEELREHVATLCSETFTTPDLRTCYQEATARCAAEKQAQKAAPAPVVSTDTSDDESEEDVESDESPASYHNPSPAFPEPVTSPFLPSAPAPQPGSANTNHASVPQQIPASSAPIFASAHEEVKKQKQTNHTPPASAAHNEIKKEKPAPQPIHDPSSSAPAIPKPRHFKKQTALFIGGALVIAWIFVWLTDTHKDETEDDNDSAYSS